jgi:hypothetical protein
MTDAEEDIESTRSYWSLFGIGGALSLCCLVAAPAASGAVGGAAGASTAATLGGGVVQVLVTAVTVGLLAGLVRLRTGGESCEA